MPQSPGGNGITPDGRFGGPWMAGGKDDLPALHASVQGIAGAKSELAPGVSGRQRANEILTCAITELGFVRVLCQAPQYGLTVAQSRTLLVRLKKQGMVPFSFIADDHDISRLPAWVKTGRQTTDGHLAELARAHDSVLATLDERIPSAFVIPG